MNEHQRRAVADAFVGDLEPVRSDDLHRRNLPPRASRDDQSQPDVVLVERAQMAVAGIPGAVGEVAAQRGDDPPHDSKERT